MKEKKYFYEFHGRVFIKAENQDQAEKLIVDTDLNDFILDEDLYAIDQNYIPIDLKKRQEQLGTKYHPLDDPEEYEAFKTREIKYAGIFNDFLNGKFDKDQLMKRMTEAKQEHIDPGALVYSVLMTDLKSQREKTARLVSVD